MNKPLRWGLGFLAGVFGANLLWYLGLESPAASFFTAAWWQSWAAAYGVAILSILFGIGRLAISHGPAKGSD